MPIVWWSCNGYSKLLTALKGCFFSLMFTSSQGTFNWRASSYPDFIQNYFLLKLMFDFFERQYTHFLHFHGSFRSFCKQKHHFSTHSLSPWVSTSSYPGKDTAIKGTLPRRSQGPRYLVTKLDDLFPLFWVNTNNPCVRCAYDNIFSFFTLSINTGSI